MKTLSLVKTYDGSYTVRDSSVNETMHTASGALTEAFVRFVLPASNFILRKRRLVVFDICFGLGYNTGALLHYWLEHKAENSELEIYGFESNCKVISIMKKIKVPEEIQAEYEAIKMLAATKLISIERVKVKLVFMDFRKGLKQTAKKADIVFFDPYSPGKVPELWNRDVFSALYNNMGSESQLNTFSCAGWVRKNMETAGFRIVDGPVFGKRGPSTIAIKELI